MAKDALSLAGSCEGPPDSPKVLAGLFVSVADGLVFSMLFGGLGIEFRFREALVGGAALDLVGVPLPEETLSVTRDSDAVLLGAIGG